MIDDKIMDAILNAMPDDMTNASIAAVLATIATAFSEEKDVNAAMHLNAAAGMVLAKMMHQNRTFN
jgi:bifunctional ADP-heptose synthase (sugar kinase/adenylyltransferase)